MHMVKTFFVVVVVLKISKKRYVVKSSLPLVVPISSADISLLYIHPKVTFEYIHK